MSDNELVIFPVQLTKTDREELKQAAKAENKSASDLVRSLLTEYMRAKSENFTGEVPAHGGDRRSEKARKRARRSEPADLAS